MADPRFVHLRMHSEFSVVDGIVRVGEAAEKAAADGMPALGLTDLANVFGMIKFYGAARAVGVKPIVGCDVWISNAQDREKPSRLLLLCQSRAGYLRLSELLSRAYRCNQSRGRAEIDPTWLVSGASEGLICLSGGPFGDVGRALLNENEEHARRHARNWRSAFPDRFYLEVQRTGDARIDALARRTLRFAAKEGLPAVATHPVQFMRPDDFRAHEARVCIAQGYVLGDSRRPKAFTPQQYFKTQAEMADLFADAPETLANSVEIAKRCNLAIELGKSCLPQFPTPQGVSLEAFLRQRALDGFGARMRELYPDPVEHERARARYRERLEFELAMIIKMGFPGYFLIVADFINWAKSNGIPVGPGRGSGAGSLVAYSLGITDLDPLRYDLLFERFLNPERVSMPDFDIDFCQEGRDRVIDYVRQKYGADSVSQIATFGTMAARAVVRDVGRVLDLGYNFCDQLAKLIPFQPGKNITLAMAREMEPQLAQRERSEEEVADLLELAGTLEGLTRNVGMHAGGVLIAPGKLTDFCPVYTAAQGSEAFVSQLDKDDVEKIGLVKFDFLGLTTLTILDWAVKNVRALAAAGIGAPEDASFDLAAVSLNDAAVYRLLSSGNTTAVFQLESRGMRDLIKRARPDRFEDIIALVALYRPGPMDLIPDFVERKHGRQRVEYLDPRLETILGQTYGVMVYQEQVMQIAQVIGGYTLGGADLLRRAMGKKKPEEMAQQRDIFLDGAVRNGLDQARASQLFDLMEKFAGYGFNKSHAAAYALVAYHTAYMKAHHPAAFMAANLSAVMDDTDKVRSLHDDARDNGITILPPDVNASGYRFTPVDARTIRYGLGAVKGTGESAIANIVEARSRDGAFIGLFDFCQRIDRRIVNRRAIESLIRAGAFDTSGAERAALVATVGLAMDEAERANLAVNQASLFGAHDAPADALPLVQTPAWDPRRRLKEEKAALGFYLSDHPFNAYRDEIRRFIKGSLATVAASAGGWDAAQSTRLVAGVIESLRAQNSPSGRTMFVNLSDGEAKLELTVYPDVFERCRRVLVEDALIVVEAKVRVYRRNGNGTGTGSGEDAESNAMRVVAEQVLDLDAARNRYARKIRIRCNGGSSGPRLRELLAPYRPGPCAVAIEYTNADASCEIELPEEWRVSAADNLVQSLAEWLSRPNVEIVYG
ncbi:MAG: DNA polymerase III subunit alpha [Burkholderiales bacterium]|nr:DNA polymerase III subunit alpha [Burkholderiales bacterium]